MLIRLLALAAVAVACIALVRRARRFSGYPAAPDPYEAADDATDDLGEPAEQRVDVPEPSAPPPAAAVGPRRTLPRRLRSVPIQFPPHVDPPLTDEQLAVVRARWPLLVSLLLRDDAN
ncbi:hypothetical protein [Streptacidiphilus rugosus]|uniref:hypothetical protein n=1 Tax=Streptacidiphilus rugosus TaxID=405783 RepID=UPI00055D957F|nr:hypothetical protein [Streptacidiphilus rugosus]